MLELLAGPFPIKDTNGDDVSLSPIIGASQPLVWDDDVGLIGYGNGTCDGYAVVQLDGLARLRAKLSSKGLMRDLPGAKLLCMGTALRDSLFTFDKRAGVIGTPVLGVPYPQAGYTGTNYVFGLGVRVPDRYLQVLNGLVRWTPLDDPTSPASEYTFSGSLSGVPTISPTRYPTVACIIWPAGSVAYYDWAAKTEVFERQYLPANHGAWYSPKLGVFVVLDEDDAINVFASTVLPDALSDPVADTPLLQGKVSGVSVTLTGSNGEPCPGEIIEWSMVGDGSLSAAQSTTDAEGVATIAYIAPLVLADDPEITATVRF